MSALYDAGYENTIGNCYNATGTKINLAEALKVDAKELFVRVYGLNQPPDLGGQRQAAGGGDSAGADEKRPEEETDRFEEGRCSHRICKSWDFCQGF